MPRRLIGGWLGAVLLALLLAVPAAGQEVPRDEPAAGRPVIEVRVVGNRMVSDTEILNAVRTEAGQPFDPRLVIEDYQRIYALRRFNRVEARYEETPEGVIVEFNVEEQPAVGELRFRGNTRFSDERLRRLVEVETGRSLDPIMLAFAQGAIEELYRSRNHALAEVQVRRDEETGTVTFDIVEGPRIFVRNIDFLGGHSFSERQLKRQISTSIFWPMGLFGRDGRYDPRRLEEDVAALQRFYRERGFFDARIGRRVVFSPDLTEVQIEFLVEEGPRYRINSIRFEGNERLSDEALGRAIRLRPGMVYDQDDVQRARLEMIRAYSPFGLIFAERSPDPEYLRIDESQVFHLEPGRLDLVFRIREGKPFRVGNIEVRGNSKTQDKVIQREFDLAPGDLYDSHAVQQAYRRLGASRFFDRLNINPIGDDPEMRDILVEVEEASTATLTFSGAVSSNGGLIGSIKYEERNFDLFDFPERPGDFLGRRAFMGAGQTFRVVLEPGTVRNNATITFIEPYLLDQKVSLATDAYWRTAIRRQFDERRAGGRVRLGPRIGRNWRTGFTVRGEDVRISGIDPPLAGRAPDILEFAGSTTLTSIGADIGYDTIDNPLLPSSGFRVSAGWDTFGALSGPAFQKVSTSLIGFYPVYRDMTDRPTVAELRLDAGYLFDDAPFFERFYGGGFGSVRGFRYRGISPRQGPLGDPVGGDFSVTGSLALGFPLVGESIRGVLFSDFGTVETGFDVDTIRASLGFGFRLQLEALGNVPFALDFAWPVNRAPEDDLQVFSFSLGVLP